MVFNQGAFDGSFLGSRSETYAGNGVRHPPTPQTTHTSVRRACFSPYFVILVISATARMIWSVSMTTAMS